MADYIVTCIEPKKGEMSETHQRVLGRPCNIVDLDIGRRALIKYEPEDEPGNYHRLLTSVVEETDINEDESVVLVETENTRYTFMRHPNANDFRGVRVMTYEDAIEDIKLYLEQQSDRYFQNLGMTKESMMNNEKLMQKLAGTHFTWVRVFGNDRMTSAEQTCVFEIWNLIGGDEI